jgi:hypothetical protein
VLTSVFGVDKMQANKHEIEQARAEGIDIRGGWAPVGVVRGADGRATALRVAQCEAKFVGPKLEIKMIEGSEQEIPADLIVSAIGQAVDFTGLEEFNSGKGAIAADKNYQVQGKPGVFTGGDVIRPHLLTTAIGHGWIAADGIDRFLRGEEQDKRAKIDVHYWDMQRKLVGRASRSAGSRSRCAAPMPPTCGAQLRQPLRPLRHHAQGAVPRPLRLHAAQHPQRHHAEQGAGAGQLPGAPRPARRQAGRGRSQALHELRPVLRVRQLRGVLPADRRLSRQEEGGDHRPLRLHRLRRSASAATSATTSARPATSRWAWASERES